ncbi:hypothetical protein AGMMS49531_01600 [Endomicrobiia bacterium]|nr:hypothetical protein AGMMS49531_01600 [Endomicrobiia bacterium]
MGVHVKYTNEDGYEQADAITELIVLHRCCNSWMGALHTIKQLLLEPEVNTLSLNEIESTAKSVYKGEGKI